LDFEWKTQLEITMKTDIETIARVRWHLDWEWLLRAEGIGSGDAVAEVGIGPLEISAIPGMLAAGCRVLGVEPLAEFGMPAIEHARAIGAADRLVLVGGAVGDPAGPRSLTIERNGGSSGVEGEWRPTPGSVGRVSVPAVDWAVHDRGHLRAVNIDCEGSEHWVLRGMQSTPRLIGIELWPAYPYRGECLEWLVGRGYECIMTSGPVGETMVWRARV
jgi:hypothetical protein